MLLLRLGHVKIFVGVATDLRMACKNDEDELLSLSCHCRYICIYFIHADPVDTYAYVLIYFRWHCWYWFVVCSL